MLDRVYLYCVFLMSDYIIMLFFVFYFNFFFLVFVSCLDLISKLRVLNDVTQSLLILFYEIKIMIYFILIIFIKNIKINY